MDEVNGGTRNKENQRTLKSIVIVRSGLEEVEPYKICCAVLGQYGFLLSSLAVTHYRRRGTMVWPATVYIVSRRQDLGSQQW